MSIFLSTVNTHNEATMTDSSDNKAQTVRDHVAKINDGTLTSKTLVEHCLNVVEQTDKNIGAWAHLDREQVLMGAEACDHIRRSGQPTGALHGIPVGIKDIFDTASMPTERGSNLFTGRQPDTDCAVVAKLKEAGAVIMGKTVTTEMAFMHPAATRNPHNPAHTPGGSSSGSAAAVAAGQVPLAVGSQTNGSVIRPASFCGVYGFKPSSGIVSRRGALETSNTLDQVGFFGRDIGDLALLADAVAGYDHLDSASYVAPKPKMLSGYQAEPPVDPTIVWIDMPYAERYSPDAHAGFEELLTLLGDKVERIPAPLSFSALIPCHKIIHEYEILRRLEQECAGRLDQLSATVKPVLEHARSYTAEQYEEALEIRRATGSWFQQFFYDYDAILTPSALSTAPLISAGGTGDPVCCTIWTLCGLPCINLPLLSGENALPLGVQLVGALREDDRLLRTTRHFLADLHQRLED